MRIFRLRTLSGSNIAGLLIGAAIFSQFFLLTLYMQQVLHYSAMQTGVAYVALTLAIIVFANVAQARRAAGRRPSRAARRAAARRRPGSSSTPGCRSTATTSGISSRPFLLSGIGMALRVHPDDDRRAGRRTRLGRGHRLGADQHDAADRRRDRRRRRDDDRGDRTRATTCSPTRARRRCGRSADARLRGRLLRPRRGRRCRRDRRRSSSSRSRHSPRRPSRATRFALEAAA